MNELVLIIVTIVIVIADIILALCVRFIMPDYMTQDGYYPIGQEAKFEEAVKICPCLAQVFPEGTDSDIVFESTKPNTRKKRQIDDKNQLRNYPFIVSLSIPAYSDDTEEKLFVCNGFITFLDQVITSKTCIENDDEWFNLTVRSESLYWSKRGKEHSVLNFTHLKDNLVLLQISPKFPVRLVPKPPLDHLSSDWIHAVTLGWDDYMYKKGARFRFMHKVFETEEWTSRNRCSTISMDTCYQPETSKISSTFLLTSCHELIGAKLVNEEKIKRFNSGLKKFEKPCIKIYKDTCKVAKIDVC